MKQKYPKTRIKLKVLLSVDGGPYEEYSEIPVDIHCLLHSLRTHGKFCGLAAPETIVSYYVMDRLMNMHEDMLNAMLDDPDALKYMRYGPLPGYDENGKIIEERTSAQQ